MVRIHFVAKFSVVMLGHTPHAVAPRTGYAQVEVLRTGVVENLLNLLLRVWLQQFVRDGAGHAMAFKAPGQSGGWIKQAEQTTQNESHSQHEPPRRLRFERIKPS